MVDGGPIDILTGDWLAELTMLILLKNRLKHPDGGYARTFLTQMEQVMGTCADRGIRIVSNAGGLNPRGLAAAVTELISKLGLDLEVAFVEGDDLTGRIDELTAKGERFTNIDTGEDMATAGITPVTANAYLGGWGIAKALDDGADIVVTGRVTDAALVIGPAASWFGWTRTDWNELAGALVAGHVIECGAQATGGNFSFFDEVDDMTHVGFPIAEVAVDGSSVITKHDGTGGLVSVDTVTAQLVYEIGDVRYKNPDVTARFDSIRLETAGSDRVSISGVIGEPPPDTTKVAINYIEGFRNSVEMVLTGLDIEAKAALAESILWAEFPDGRDTFDAVDVELIRTDQADPAFNDAALARLRVTVTDRDETTVGRAFSSRVVETALASYPGFFAVTPPGSAKPVGVYWPTTVSAAAINQRVLLGDEVVPIEPVVELACNACVVAVDRGKAPTGETLRAPLGSIIGARSGDKGGNANVGLWARTDAAYAWLEQYLTVAKMRELFPTETDGLKVERHDFANIRALNFVIIGLLGRGVASSTRTDAQAKGLGEYMRARIVDIPAALIEEGGR